MAVWRPAEDKKAWGTPVRPDEIKVPLDVWRKGWHLCLHRHVLAWLLARYLPNYRRDPNGSTLRAAMGERYLGVSKHIRGTILARQIDISVSAPLWLATRLLNQLSKRDIYGANQPEVQTTRMNCWSMPCGRRSTGTPSFCCERCPIEIPRAVSPT